MTPLQRAMEGLPLTAKEAKRRGISHYFSGKPCINGHLLPRLATTRGCPGCQKMHVQNNRRRYPEKAIANCAAYYAANAERRRQYGRDRYKNHRARVVTAREKWRRANLGLDAASTMRRKAAKLRATPQWADHEAIKKVYSEAASITASSGVPHEVDHIVPLQGANVCGLHVHWNLQVITKSANSRKKNRMIDHMLAEGE